MGGILAIYPFNLKAGKRAEYAEWQKKYEEPMRKAMAKVGATYRGTYLSTFGLAPTSGVTLIEYSSYEDLDAWRELHDPQVGEAMGEMMKLTEPTGLSTQLYEQTPEAFEDVVSRKYKGKRSA